MPEITSTRISDQIVGLDCRAWAYLAGEGRRLTMIDTGFANDATAMLNAAAALGIESERIESIILTHCHPDHTGSLAELIEVTGAQSIAHRLDAPYVRGDADIPDADLAEAERPIFEAIAKNVATAPHARVDREVEDGDEINIGTVGRVVHLPGHTPGSIAIHLPDRRALILGDAVANVSGTPVVGYFNVDREAAAASFRRASTLDIDIASFGHGAPIRRDASAAFRLAAAKV